MTPRGLFISFEGIEGAGKSTQVLHARQVLEQQGHTVCLVREPGGTPVGDQIRRLLLTQGDGPRSALSELLLFCASRAELVETVIRPALARGEMVLSDRFVDSTLAYQGYARGLPLETIQSLNRIATSGLLPDLTLLLDLPVEEGLSRATRRAALVDDGAERDRFEAQALEFHQRVRQGFLACALAEPHRFVQLDARQSPEQLSQQVKEHLQHGLSRHSRA